MERESESERWLREGYDEPGEVMEEFPVTQTRGYETQRGEDDEEEYEGVEEGYREVQDEEPSVRGSEAPLVTEGTVPRLPDGMKTRAIEDSRYRRDVATNPPTQTRFPVAADRRIVLGSKPEQKPAREDWPLTTLVKAIASVICIHAGDRLEPISAYDSVFSATTKASAIVSNDSAGEAWNIDRTHLEFARALYSEGLKTVNEFFASDVDTLLTAADTTDLQAGVSSNSIFTSSGIKVRTTINVLSSDRNRSVGPLPNVIQVPIASDTGISLERSIRRVTRVRLLSVRMHDLLEDGSSFYILISELSTDFNRQTDPFSKHCHFKCAFRERPGRDRVEILTRDIILASAVDLSANITFRLYDIQKQPLAIEQDTYKYLGHVWDDVNEAIIFEIPNHSIQSGDRISIRNIVCTEDQDLFAESKRLRAEVVDLSHIRVYAWRAQIGVDPEGGRHIVSDGGYIVCLPKVVEISIEIGHKI